MKKRLLILSPRFPYPVIGGDRLRIFHICKALSQSFDLSLLTFCETKEELRFSVSDGPFSTIHRVYLPRWKSYLNSARALLSSKPLQIAYYYSPEFQAAVDRLLPEHDGVLAHLIRTGQYVAGRNEPAILEMTDAISLNYGRIADIHGVFNWKKLVYRFERSRLLRYEISVLKKFRHVWLVSEIDRDFLATESAPHVEVIPNGVDLSRLAFENREGDVIAFIGNIASVQNQDACFHFVRDIFPKIRERARLRFRVIGNIPEGVAEKLRLYPGVEVTGRFEEIDPVIGQVFCGVCPVRAAAGIQNKILEYLALGIPCLTSRVGLEGINAIEDEQLLAYDHADEAVEKILRLHSDAVLRRRLAREGRTLIERSYNWQNVYPIFQSSVSQALDGYPTRTTNRAYGQTGNGIFRPAAG